MTISVPTFFCPGWQTDNTAILDESIKYQKVVGGTEWGYQQLPGDTLYLASVTLINVQPNSNYWIGRSANLATVLATGTQSSTSSADIVLTGIAAIASAETITVRVREYGTAKYLPFETQAVMTRTGCTVYIAQTLDGIGT